MDPMNHAGREQKASPKSITSALVSAVLEWLLIFMLFIDASFSYLVTKFARYSQLRIPCLLCSRLDHILGNETGGFVWDLICQKHKLNISSLIFCRIHNNLIDVHGTCESCFFSFAKINKSNAETYRLLVGKLGAEPNYGLSQGDECNFDSSGMRKCFCCNERLVSRSFQYDRDEVHEIVEKSSQLDNLRNSNNDHLPHVDYKKINITSDTESEAPFSDNESSGAIISEMDKDSIARHVPPEHQIIAPADCHLINASPSFSSLLESDNTSNVNVEYKGPVLHGLEELNWHQVDHKNDASVTSELISFDQEEILPSFNGNETHHDESKEIDVTSIAELGKEIEINYGESSKMVGDSRKETTESRKEVPIESRETTYSHITESLDLGDAYRLALGTRGRQLSGRLFEHQMSMNDSTKASEDLKLLLTQISATRGIELSSNDGISPRRVSPSSYEDYKIPEASIGIQILQRRISLERNESNLSLDGSIISEIEGESVVDRLKRQVEYDKKIMSALYKELEEERNASAIAANQAMAMITRLQEEKATLNMEALQFLRMMEEQAEYDGEALQEANDMLVEKEKRIQEIEAELDELKLKEENNESNFTVLENPEN